MKLCTKLALSYGKGSLLGKRRMNNQRAGSSDGVPVLPPLIDYNGIIEPALPQRT